MGAPDDLPEEIALLDSLPAIEAFRALNPQQRVFVLAYINEGNGAEAYRQAYNNLASDTVAATCASRLLTYANIKAVLLAFRDHQEEDFRLVRQTFIDAAKTATKPIFGKDEQGQPILVMEQPDHDARTRAASALSKLQGLNAAEKTEVTGANGGPVNFAVSINFVRPDGPGDQG